MAKGFTYGLRMLNETEKSDVNYLTTCSSQGYTARKRGSSCFKTSVSLDMFASKCLNYGSILGVIWNILTEETSPGLDHTLLCEALLSLVSCRLRQALHSLRAPESSRRETGAPFWHSIPTHPPLPWEGQHTPGEQESEARPHANVPI